MTKREIITITLLSLSVFFVANFAQFWGVLTSPKEMIFLGGHVPNSGDFSMTLPQMRDGHLLIKNLFTAEYQPRIFLATSFIPQVLLGNIFSLSDFNVVLIGKLLYTTFLLFVFWKYLSLSIKEFKDKLWIMMVLTFFSGWGFILNYFIPNSIDLWIPEATFFHTVMFLPNFVFLQLLLLSSFYLFYLFFRTNRKSLLIISAGLLFLLSLEHPFDVLTALLAVFLYAGFSILSINKLFIKGILLFSAFIPALLSIGVQFLLINHFPTVSAWTKQTNLQNPSLISFVTGFGFVGILAFKNIFSESWQKTSLFRRLNFFWILSSLFLVFTPLPFQRRFLEGIFIPLSIFAAPEFQKLFDTIIQKINGKIVIRRLLGILFFTLFFLISSSSNIFLIYQDIKAFNLPPQNSPFYIYRNDLIGLLYLKNHSQENDVVLADGFYSPLIPNLIGRTVYFGHRVGTALTINPQKKTENAKRFFLEENDHYRKDFLKNNNIKFIFLGKKGSQADHFSKWDEKPYLKKIYQGDGVKIFRFSPSQT